MHSIENPVQDISAIHDMIVAHKQHHSHCDCVDKFTDFISKLKTLGMLDGLQMADHSARYFIIDGNSWMKNYSQVKQTHVPFLVLLEEFEFFKMLETILSSFSSDKSAHARKSHTHA
jgi:hypothetical protein